MGLKHNVTYRVSAADSKSHSLINSSIVTLENLRQIVRQYLWTLHCSQTVSLTYRWVVRERGNFKRQFLSHVTTFIKKKLVSPNSLQIYFKQNLFEYRKRYGWD